MICPNCGKVIPDESRFCGYCGSQVDKVEERPADLTMEGQVIDENHLEQDFSHERNIDLVLPEAEEKETEENQETVVLNLGEAPEEKPQEDVTLEMAEPVEKEEQPDIELTAEPVEEKEEQPAIELTTEPVIEDAVEDAVEETAETVEEAADAVLEPEIEKEPEEETEEAPAYRHDSIVEEVDTEPKEPIVQADDFKVLLSVLKNPFESYDLHWIPACCVLLVTLIANVILCGRQFGYGLLMTLLTALLSALLFWLNDKKGFDVKHLLSETGEALLIPAILLLLSSLMTFGVSSVDGTMMLLSLFLMFAAVACLCNILARKAKNVNPWFVILISAVILTIGAYLIVQGLFSSMMASMFFYGRG